MKLISVKEAAKVLHLSIYRIHQMTKEPCPKCGRWERVDAYHRRLLFDPNCLRCHGTGFRLPIADRAIGGHRAPLLFRVEDIATLIKERFLS